MPLPEFYDCLSCRSKKKCLIPLEQYRHKIHVAGAEFAHWSQYFISEPRNLRNFRTKLLAQMSEDFVFPLK